MAKALPKTTAQCPRPGFGTGPLDLKLSTLTKCEYHGEMSPRERIPYKDEERDNEVSGRQEKSHIIPGDAWR